MFIDEKKSIELKKYDFFALVAIIIVLPTHQNNIKLYITHYFASS